MRPLKRLRAVRRFRRRARRAGGNRVGGPAGDIVGARPDGSPVEIVMAGRWNVLLFLTSTCYGCRVLWDDLAAHSGLAGGAPRPGTGAVLVVTPSASTESTGTVAGLAPPGVEVVMSTEAWNAYGVRKAPWCVVVAGGVVVADGPAPTSWSDLTAVTGALSAPA